MYQRLVHFAVSVDSVLALLCSAAFSYTLIHLTLTLVLVLPPMPLKYIRYAQSAPQCEVPVVHLPNHVAKACRKHSELRPILTEDLLVALLDSVRPVQELAPLLVALAERADLHDYDKAKTGLKERWETRLRSHAWVPLKSGEFAQCRDAFCHSALPLQGEDLWVVTAATTSVQSAAALRTMRVWGLKHELTWDDVLKEATNVSDGKNMKEEGAIERAKGLLKYVDSRLRVINLEGVLASFPLFFREQRRGGEHCSLLCARSWHTEKFKRNACCRGGESKSSVCDTLCVMRPTATSLYTMLTRTCVCYESHATPGNRDGALKQLRTMKIVSGVPAQRAGSPSAHRLFRAIDVCDRSDKPVVWASCASALEQYPQLQKEGLHMRPVTASDLVTQITTLAGGDSINQSATELEQELRLAATRLMNVDGCKAALKELHDIAWVPSPLDDEIRLLPPARVTLKWSHVLYATPVSFDMHQFKRLSAPLA
jgi:hypothetical protein